MRDIKFRAWDKTNNVWVTQHHHAKYITGADSTVIYELQTNGGQFEYMQYTGLNDKNSVEIYEGDIVRYVNPKLGIEDYHLRFVVWDKKHCAFRICKIPKNKTDFRHYHIEMSQTDTKRLAVIGNIYENPELLK